MNYIGCGGEVGGGVGARGWDEEYPIRRTQFESELRG